jgi:menaquinone-specific isochorismate synthase
VTATLWVRTAEVPDPGELLARQPEPGGLAWVRRGEGLIGWGTALRLDLAPPEPIRRAGDALAGLAALAEVDDPVTLPGSGLVAFVSCTFDPAAVGSVLIVPALLLGRRAGRAWITTISCDGPADEPVLGPVHAAPAPSRIRYAGSSSTELRWLEAVASATRRIAAGALDKVVLARDLAVWSEQPLDGRTLTRRLAERFPDCFTFSVDGLVGATPELLVRRLGRAVDSVVLAGTAARGADPDADTALGDELLASQKDRDEHTHAVASVRAVLAPRLPDLEVDGPSLLRLDNVQHLASELRGTLAHPDETVLELAAALHPTAAVCGTPTELAFALIGELEGLDRARYAGPVGWVDRAGDGELGIALRCAEVDGTRARLFAGAGIVRASLPEAELEETRIKLLAFQAALEGGRFTGRRTGAGPSAGP